MRRSTRVREWMDRELAEEWSPYGDRIWEHSDPERGVGLVVCVAGRTLRVVAEGRADGFFSAFDVPLDAEAARSLAAFLHDQVLRPRDDEGL